MRSRRIIERLLRERKPKPTFVRLVGLFGMFLGIVISGYDFEGSLPSLIIGVVMGYYIAERGALFLYGRRPGQLAISDRLGVWIVRILCLVCGLGSIVMGYGLLAPIRSPVEFGRLSGAGFFIVGGIFMLAVAFGRLTVASPQLTTAVLGLLAFALLIVSILAFVTQQEVFFIVIGLLIPGGILAQLVSMRKYPHKPLDEMAWYALSGRLYRLLPPTKIQPPRSE